MRRTTEPPAALHSSAFFTFEKPSASLNDLEIVRKIVEREGCLEALEQLVTAPQRKTTVKASTATGAVGLELDQLYLYTFPRRQSTATTSPLVLQSVLDQLRSVSVQIVEAIENWRAANGMQVFQWRNANYLLKMAGDVDFLAQTVGIAGINALQQLRLERNPFLAPLHLDHAALREKVPDAAILLGAWVGNVDMKRIFYVSKVLLRELETERMQQQQEANDEDEGEGGDGNFKTDHLEPSVLTASRHSMLRHPATTMRVRWRHQSVQLRPQQQFGNESTGYDGDGSQVDAALSVEDTMRQDVALCKELILHAEHELGAIREEIAILQEKLNMDITPLSETKRRTLQIKVGALTNTLKFKSGDLYQRKNELRRKEAVLHQRLNDTQHGGRTTRSRRSQPSSSSSSPPQRVGTDADDAAPHPYLKTVEHAMQDDELHRHDIMEKFTTLAKMKAAASSTTRQKFKQQSLQRNHGGAPSPSAKSITSRQLHDAMTPERVAAFIDSLELGSEYGAAFLQQRIDGAMLQQATHGDLEELGVSLRLHRVRILDAITSADQG